MILEAMACVWFVRRIGSVQALKESEEEAELPADAK